MRKILIILFVLTVASYSHATDFFVAESGAGAGDGSTYANRMSRANYNSGNLNGSTNPGDTVYFCGSLSTNITVQEDGSSGSQYILSGDCSTGSGGSGTDAVLDAGDNQVAIQTNGHDYVTIRYFTVSNVDDVSICTWIQADTADNLVVEYNNFSDAGTQGGGIGIYVGDGTKTNSMTVQYNTLAGPYAVGMYVHGNNITIQHNIFTNTSGRDAARGIELRDVNGSHSQNVVMWYNSFLNLGNAQGVTVGILPDGDTNGDNSDYHVLDARYNYFYNCQGRCFDGFMGESIIADNYINTVVDGESGSGIGIEINGPDNQLYNNTIINPQNMGWMFNNDPIAPNVASVSKNNIVVCASCNWLAWVSNLSGYEPTISNNIYYQGGNDTEFYYEPDGGQQSWANWQTYSGDTNSYNADPSLNSDGTLPAGSSYLTAGADLGVGNLYRVLNPALYLAGGWPNYVFTINPDQHGWPIGAFGRSVLFITIP